MRTFAQISGGICVAIIQGVAQPVAVAGDEFVEIPEYDTSYLGRAFADGEWE